MNLTTVYWILSIALVIATCVMAASLVSIVVSIVEQVQRICGRHIRS